MLAVPFEVRLAALALALFIPFQNHLRYGQLNLLLLCLTSLFLAFHLRRRGPAAAASLGSAIALKLTPAVFLLYLGRGRSYRTALGAIGWTLLLAVGLPALISPRVLELYRVGWLPEVLGLTSGPVEYEWRTRFTLAAVLTEIWPRPRDGPGPPSGRRGGRARTLLWIQPRLARDPRGGLFLFALYTTAMPLVSPVSETHHLAVLAGRSGSGCSRRARRRACRSWTESARSWSWAVTGSASRSPGPRRAGRVALRRHVPAPAVRPPARPEPPDDPGRWLPAPDARVSEAPTVGADGAPRRSHP